MKMLKRANSLFLLCEISSAVLKTWKTKETKTQILYPIQGKGCYWLSKLAQIKKNGGVEEALWESTKESLTPIILVFGCETFLRGDIAAQSQQTLKFCVR